MKKIVAKDKERQLQSPSTALKDNLQDSLKNLKYILNCMWIKSNT